MPVGETTGCQPREEKSYGGLDEETHPMRGGRNPPNKNLSGFLSALPEPRGAFLLSGLLM